MCGCISLLKENLYLHLYKSPKTGNMTWLYILRNVKGFFFNSSIPFFSFCVLMIPLHLVPMATLDNANEAATS